MRVLFRVFESKMASREKLFKHAADYASQLGRDRVISISHSEDRDNMVITVWYWGEEEEKPARPQPSRAPASPPPPPPPPPAEEMEEDVETTRKIPPRDLGIGGDRK